jgi:hypothetical protein
MKSAVNRDTWAKNLVDGILQTPERLPGMPGQETPAEKIPDSMVDWLGQAALFYGVPFEYLVPDPSMLPVESIRFFFIDGTWVRRLIDGAVSAGINDTADALLTMLNFENVVEKSIHGAAALRYKLRDKPVPDDATVSSLQAGFLLRSQVVRGWPGLEVTAVDSTGAPVHILRMDRLSSDVLLCLFNGLPETVTLQEPTETLHFGVETPDAPFVYLRSVGGDVPLGKQYLDKNNVGIKVGVSMRNADLGVMNAAATAAAIKKKLDDVYPDFEDQNMTAAEMSIEMIKAAGQISFDHGTPVTPPSVQPPKQ